MKHKLFFLSVITVFLLPACITPYATFTDMYFITNEAEDPILLNMEKDVVWDTCAALNPQRVWLASNCLYIAPGQTVRLHPVRRDFKDYRGSYKMNVAQIIGSATQLVAGEDTILWEVKYLYMFATDSVWSIYNTRDWQTVEDQELPYTFYHTFTITSDKIERSIQ